MSILVRLATENDLPAADELLRAAFARPTDFIPHLRLHRAMQPDMLWLAEDDGQLVGSVAAVDYDGVAYIGLMAVHPSRQRQGIAQRLVTHLLATLDQRGCHTVLLDATLPGGPLYEGFGFVDDAIARALELETLVVPEVSDSIMVSMGAELAELASFDAAAFGANREKLLREHLRMVPDRLLVSRDRAGRLQGYLFARDPILGPWVATDRDVATSLLASGLRLPFTMTPHVMIPRSNQASYELLKQHGFAERRQLRHMRRGGNGPVGKPERLFGQSSFGHG